jgi:hypothetical protein
LAFMVIWRLDLAVSQIPDPSFLLAKLRQINNRKPTTALNPYRVGLNIVLMVVYRPINFFLQFLHR